MDRNDVAAEPGRRGAVGVVFRAGRMLVIRRAENVAAPGAYCFPGGGIEGNEADEEALVREIREELGVEVRPVKPLWRSVTPWQVDLSWWLADLDDPEGLRPNPAEVQSVCWVTIELLFRCIVKNW